MFFYTSDISHFHSFGCPLGLQLGSLRQKCDPDRCAQNSHKSRLCFFTCQTFFIFIRLSVPWDPNLDPCGENVFLAGARKIHIKSFAFCYPSDISHVHSFGCPLGSRFGSLQQKYDPARRAQNSHKSRLCFFNHLTFSIFMPLAAPLVSQLGSLLQKCDTGRCDQNSHKNRLCFLPFGHFPFSFLWLSLGWPTWVLATKVGS